MIVFICILYFMLCLSKIKYIYRAKLCFCILCVLVYGSCSIQQKNVLTVCYSCYLMISLCSFILSSYSFSTHRFVKSVNAPALCKGHTWYCLMFLAFPHSLSPWISVHHTAIFFISPLYSLVPSLFEHGQCICILW